MMYRTARTISTSLRILPFAVWRVLWRLTDIFEGRFGAGLRYILISGRLANCGTRLYIGPFVCITQPSKLSVGDSVSIHHFTTIIADGGILIGDNVSIAHGSSLVSTTHTYEDASVPIKYNAVTLKPITIASDVWIGAKVTIIGGVSVGGRTVIGAGSVVTSDCAEGSIYVGVPARRLRST